MNVYALTRYSRSGASSRLRFFQYDRPLKALGFNVYYESMFSEAYIRAIQGGQTRPYEVMRSIRRRISALSSARLFDLIWLEKDALPWLPALLELSLLPSGIPLVLDYDDAVFHQYDRHPSAIVRRLLGSKHQVLMQRADLVVVGNQYIADYALKMGASRVELLPTVVDLQRYGPRRAFPDVTVSTPPMVGWIGQKSTALCLLPLKGVFERLSSEGLVQFRAIGIDASNIGLPMESEEWSEDTEVSSLHNLDVGIMPLNDGYFERGKCGYKLIQYMACGLPVVASPVGVNKSIVEHGVNGYLADTLDEWEWALRALAADSWLRQRLGQAGRSKVERLFGLHSAANSLVGWFEEAVHLRGAK